MIATRITKKHGAQSDFLKRVFFLLQLLKDHSEHSTAASSTLFELWQESHLQHTQTTVPKPKPDASHS